MKNITKFQVLLIISILSVGCGEEEEQEEPQTLINAPTNLIFTVKSDTEIDLTWSDNSDEESGFKIERSTEFGETISLSVNANEVSFDDVDLLGNTVYHYKIRATSPSGSSSVFSNEVTATTNKTLTLTNPWKKTIGSVNYTWTISENGHSAINGSNGLSAIVSYSLSNDEITLNDGNCGSSSFGIYRLQLNDKILTLIPISDTCSSRKGIVQGDWSL